MNFPSFTAIRNIPNQLSVDSKNFYTMNDLKVARNALFMANLIKLFGLALFLGEVSRILKIDPKIKLRAPMTKLKWLKFFWVSILSRECLIIGDNVFELYGRRPAGATIFLHESKMQELADKKFKDWSLSYLWDIAVNTGKAAFSTATQPEEVALIKQIAFIFQNSTTEKAFQIWHELSKNFKK